jgi:hypothetical protein
VPPSIPMEINPASFLMTVCGAAIFLLIVFTSSSLQNSTIILETFLRFT